MKTSYEKAKKRIMPLLLGGLAVLSLTGCSKKPESSIDNVDANGDGIQDVVIFNGENRDYFAFLGQEDGTFKKAEIVTQDGIPFYVVGDTVYSPWGSSFGNYRH